MEKTILRRRFNPDNYGMIYCPVCKGSGKLLNEFEAGVVCKVCGGFGLIKKEEKNSPHPNGHNHVYQGLC